MPKQMNGGLRVIKRFMDRYQLTEEGAKGLRRSSIASFFKYLAFMAPIIIIMYFVQGLLYQNLKSVHFYIIGILLTGIIMYIIIERQYEATYKETYQEASNLRIEIAEILRELPLSYYSRHNLSDVAQTIMQDVSDIEHALSHALPDFHGFIPYLLIVSVLLLLGDFKLGLCVVIPMLVGMILFYLSKSMQEKATGKFYLVNRENTEKFQKAIDLNQEIRAYGLKNDVGHDLVEFQDVRENEQIKSELSQALPLQLSQIIVVLSLGMTIYFGSQLYIDGETNLVMLLGYILAAVKLINGLQSLYMNISEVIYIDSRVKRIKSIKQEPLQTGKEDITLDSFDIEFKNVSFSYYEGQGLIKDLTFTAQQDQVTSIIGPSGCGKTTVLRLVSRLYDYDSGSITIGGVDIKAIATETLFNYISMVFQDVILFNKSVLENIRVGRPDASDEEVIQAAKLANCQDFVDRLDGGYDTYIGENGAKLSGGERQRISIARAFLKDAPIILLDEISSSLDVINEMKVQESLNKLIEDKTVLIVSHRLKSIEKTDKIVVLNNGRVDSIGDHDSLMKDSELYQDLVEKSQLAEDFEY
ncbi:ABC transporter ATP-binding protein [Suicoccus acidiformans]|uniref:ABC transporter ATP-binding protein n=2 Tax=Suicoccus acidiformans TaxID=2036206 RepID=A0A347WJ71_9LACT|nr:ABC transporter ATP-binding protein [Suicoccus acidiformans]